MDGWSVAWHNAARVRLALGEVKDVPDTYELRAVKRNHGPKGQPVALRFHEGALLPVDAVPDDGKAASARAACVDAAIHAAGLGAPFTRQRNIAPSIVADISKKAGVTLTSKRIKEELDAACHGDGLYYQHGYSKVRAGYFPAPKVSTTRPEAAETAASATPPARNTPENYINSGGNQGGNPVETESGNPKKPNGNPVERGGGETPIPPYA